jgi:hypothetical protein
LAAGAKGSAPAAVEGAKVREFSRALELGSLGFEVLSHRAGDPIGVM